MTTSLREYLRMAPETRATLDPFALLDTFARRHAKALREGAKRVEKLNGGIATDMRDAANFLAPEQESGT